MVVRVCSSWFLEVVVSAVGRVSWLRWARGLEGLTPTESLIVHELARPADWRGEVICPVG